MGTLAAGEGLAAIERIIACAGLPCPAASTFWRAVETIAPMLIGLADDSMEKALDEEEERLKRESAPICVPVDGGDDIEAYALPMLADGAWAKRSKRAGHGNSHLGYGAVMGEMGKIIGREVKQRSCVKCENAERDKGKAREHKCPRNWIGSSKAMEAGALGDVLIRIMKERRTIPSPLVMDGDSSTSAQVRERCRPDPILWVMYLMIVFAPTCRTRTFKTFNKKSRRKSRIVVYSLRTLMITSGACARRGERC